MPVVLQNWKVKSEFPLSAGKGGMKGGKGSKAAAAGGPAPFKTRMCNFFLEGRCTKDEGCTFAHDESELSGGGGFESGAGGGGERLKTKMCTFFLQGMCTKDEACSFAHDEGEIQGGGGKASWGPSAPYKGGKGFKGKPLIGWAQAPEPLWFTPAAGKGQGGSGMKTKLCNFFLEGKCTKGEACTFAHDALDIGTPSGAVHVGTARSPSQMCRFFLEGTCTKGSACTFAHDPSEMQGAKGSFGKGAWLAPALVDGARAPSRMCNFFLQGACTKGIACTFAHDESELQGFQGYAKGGKVGALAKGKGFFGGLFGKGKDMGKGKGKGKDKGKSKTPGHTLPRERLTEEPLAGTVLEWKGKYGWIQPGVEIEHEKAARHGGKIFISGSDLADGLTELTPGATVTFHVFSDASGLGAEECWQEEDGFVAV